MNEGYALSYRIFIVTKFNIKMQKYKNKPLHLEDLQVTLKNWNSRNQKYFLICAMKILHAILLNEIEWANEASLLK